MPQNDVGTCSDVLLALELLVLMRSECNEALMVPNLTEMMGTA